MDWAGKVLGEVFWRGSVEPLELRGVFNKKGELCELC